MVSRSPLRSVGTSIGMFRVSEPEFLKENVIGMDTP